MAYKTIYRAAYNDVIIDSSKIDAQFAKLSQIQDEFNAEPTPTEDITHEVINETASQAIAFELDTRPPQQEPTPKKSKAAITPEITDFPE
jgi:recombination protein RecT